MPAIKSQLTIEFRHHQLTSSSDGSNVLVQCTAGIAAYIPGTVDGTWYEMTDYCEGLDKLNLSWDAANQGASNGTAPSGSNIDKGISLELTFYGNAYTFIDDWLLANPCQTLNAIDVRITDKICGKSFRLFEIKVDNLTYSPYRACQFEVRLREQDLVWSCIHRTAITDNWQDWFKDGSSKEHPCFLTGIDPRPRILNSVRMAFLLFLHANPLVTVIDFITAGSIEDDATRILGFDHFSDAPLVRDYILNVTNKCGVAVDTIFNEPASPYYNLCLYYPSNGSFHKNDEGTNSPALWFHNENRWLIAFDDWLDKLKLVFNAEWYVTPGNTLVFKNRSFFDTLAIIYDFTAPGAFAINEDLEYTFDGGKKAAYGRYTYQTDGSDLASQEMANLYNDIVDYDGEASNPMLEGDTTKNFEFAPTGFVRDGRSEDFVKLLINDGETGAYILVGVLVVIVAALFAGTLSAVAGVALAASLAIWVGLIASRANGLRNKFGEGTIYDGAVRLTSEQVMTPRLLLWDGVSKSCAKVVKFNADDDTPEINSFYNPNNEVYSVQNNIGIDNSPLRVYNYPMYFDAPFQGNLYALHDVTDNPIKSLETFQEWTMSIDLCCEAMDVFGLWQDSTPKIGALVKLESRANYDVYGRIKHIDADYNTNTILLKGKVFKR